MKPTSHVIKDDFLLILHDEHTDSYSYYIYHVLDISIIDDVKMVNIQFIDSVGVLHRISLTYDAFIDLIVSKALIPLT